MRYLYVVGDYSLRQAQRGLRDKKNVVHALLETNKLLCTHDPVVIDVDIDGGRC